VLLYSQYQDLENDKAPPPVALPPQGGGSLPSCDTSTCMSNEGCPAVRCGDKGGAGEEGGGDGGGGGGGEEGAEENLGVRRGDEDLVVVETSRSIFSKTVKSALYRGFT